MSRIPSPLAALTLALCLAPVGCGDARTEQADTPDVANGVNEYLPLAEGNTWQFKVTDGSTVTDKTTVVMEKEAVGGSGPNSAVEAFFVVTTKTGAATMDRTESWQGTVVIDEDETKLATVRYREIAYHAMDGTKELEEHWNPPKLRVDNFHTALDPEWTEEYTESKIPADTNIQVDAMPYDVWIVRADAVQVTVPAGTFTAKHVQRQSTGAMKDYWFVKKVGKVKETGGQTEELEDCTIGGKTCAELAE